MRVVQLNNEFNDLIYIGTGREIKNLYRNLYIRGIYYAYHIKMPTFMPFQNYGILVEGQDMTWISASEVLGKIIKEGIKWNGSKVLFFGSNAESYRQ